MLRSCFSFPCHKRSLNAIQFQLQRTSRFESTGRSILLSQLVQALILIVYAAVYTAKTISPALLARARSISAEHDRLSQQISTSYDVKIARKAGQLSATVKALNEWESEQKVQKQNLISQSHSTTKFESSVSWNSRICSVIL